MVSPNRWSWNALCVSSCGVHTSDKDRLLSWEGVRNGMYLLESTKTELSFCLSYVLVNCLWCSSHSDFNTLWSLRRTTTNYVIMAYLITLNWNYLPTLLSPFCVISPPGTTPYLCYICPHLQHTETSPHAPRFIHWFIWSAFPLIFQLLKKSLR